MSQHRAKIEWRHAGGEFSYETYSRSHEWTFPNGTVVEASAAPTFLGDESRVDPEEAFVAAAASCHMLTFLAVAARKRLSVESYRDDAVGFLEKNEDGKLAVTVVNLRPRVAFSEGAEPTPEALEKLHAVAHRECFIANSVRTDIRIDLGDADADASAQ